MGRPASPASSVSEWLPPLLNAIRMAVILLATDRPRSIAPPATGLLLRSSGGSHRAGVRGEESLPLSENAGELLRGVTGGSPAGPAAGGHARARWPPPAPRGRAAAGRRSRTAGRRPGRRPRCR